ncbi:MAG: ORC1-type DNA replication protein [Candidatus Nezhaarchaeota archaeon]|nr:ORC1-type DNA replication protein [Candidatus Nezhaarchaeota archaeon]
MRPQRELSLEGLFTPRSRLFRDEGRLSPDYVPLSLPHRETQLEEIANLFSTLLRQPGGSSVKVWLVGGVGSGKTATSKRFGALLEQWARRQGVDVRYVHVNCYKDRTFFVVAKHLAQRILPSLPERGFSAQELLDLTRRALNDQDAFLVAALDEVDYLVRAMGEYPLYALSRFCDEHLNAPERLSLILISRSHPSLFKLSAGVASGSWRGVVYFDPYTSSQVLDILRRRAEEAFIDGAVDEEALSLVADLTGVDERGAGDARFALELLWWSGKIAEGRGLRRIEPDTVRKAYAQLNPFFNREALSSLTNHERLLLLAIARALRKTGKAYVSTGEVEAEYVDLCKMLREEPRRHTRLWSLIKALTAAGLIYSKVVCGRGGRTTLMNLAGVEAAYLEGLLSPPEGGRAWRSRSSYRLEEG